MGSTLHHDDSLTDRTEGELLDRSYRSTKQLWFEEFGEDYVVDGGMYRGEPPNDYFSMQWKSDDFSLIVVAPEMGAYATSTNTVSSPTIVRPPTKWAKVNGTTSGGSPAFVAPSKTGHRNALKEEEHKENYILGQIDGKVGYFHVETKEAYRIMLSRLRSRIHRIESQVAMEKGCCGPQNDPLITENEKELKTLKEAYSEIFNRSKAIRPSGAVARDPNRPTNTNAYYDSTGLWLYPPIMWDSCGGACGGGVACSVNVGGAAACIGGAFEGRLFALEEIIAK